MPHLQSPEAGLCSGPGGTWRQEGASALGQEAIPTMRNEAKALQDQEDSLCPREEDTALIQGGPRCPIHHYLLVRTPKVFNQAKVSCRCCLGGREGNAFCPYLVPVWMGGSQPGFRTPWAFC